jgi:hypothetical protein
MAESDFASLDEIGEPGEHGYGGHASGDPYGGQDPGDGPVAVPSHLVIGSQKNGQATKGGAGGSDWSLDPIKEGIIEAKESVIKAVDFTSALVGGKSGLSDKQTANLQNAIIAEEKAKAATQTDEELTDQQLYDRTTEGSDPQSMKEVAINLDPNTIGINEADVAGFVAGIAIPIPGAGFAVAEGLKSMQKEDSLFKNTTYDVGYVSPTFGMMANPTNPGVAMADFQKDPAYGGEGGSVNPLKVPVLPRPEYGELNKSLTGTKPTDNKVDLGVRSRSSYRARRRQGIIGRGW